MTTALDNIPQDLRSLPQWLVWKYVTRDGSTTKVPFQPTGAPADSTDPATWTTFGQVIEAEGYDGIGCVFAPVNGMVGIDLDNSVEDGELKPWARGIVDRFDTYTEISPSGTGVKLWCYGKWPGDNTGGRRKFRDGFVEMYCRARYFAVTGQRINTVSHEIEERQEKIDGLFALVFAPKPTARRMPPPSTAAASRGDEQSRCIEYLRKCPEAVAGNRGHDSTLRAACECFRFGLSDNEAWAVMEWWNSTKAHPAWSVKELAHKIESARAKVEADGEFGLRNRQIDKPAVPIEPPPAESSDLSNLLGDITSGKFTNVEWPYAPALTRGARSLLPGTTTVLCGSGGSTKSMWISQCCIGWLEAGVEFAVFHLEEDRKFHQLRALAQLARDSRLTDDEWMRTAAGAVADAYETHMGTLDALGKRIWDAPGSDISLDDLVRWVGERADAGCRVIVIDPITAADSGKEPWSADRKFILETKRIMRRTGSSLVLVTHPRSEGGKGDQGSRLDNLAGGRAYNRFTQCVLWMEPCEAEAMTIRTFKDLRGPKHQATVNRILRIIKTRNGPGSGRKIGSFFDPQTLCFEERGPIIEEEKQ